MYGPMSILVVGFDTSEFTGKIRPAFDELRKSKVIRVIDALVVKKDGEGAVLAEQVSDLSDADREELGAVVGGLIGFGYDGPAGMEAGATLGALAVSEHDYGLSAEEIKGIADEMPNNSSALIVILEHLWAKRVKQELVSAGGNLLAHGFIDPRALVAVGAYLREFDEELESVA
jgi:uncharacterized membrane protein